MFIRSLAGVAVVAAFAGTALADVSSINSVRIVNRNFNDFPGSTILQTVQYPTTVDWDERFPAGAASPIIKEHRENGEELERVIGPGPENPLGRYAFYLGWPSYMIHGTNKPAGVGLRSSHGCLRLYPEDIEELFESVPVGTPVRVVNEPFTFGWQNDELSLQAFDVLEDDPRDWKKAERKLLSKSLSESIRKELKRRGETVDWERFSTLTHDPRGIPVSISRADVSLEQVVASAPRVQNRVPDGASWDGKSDLPMDEESFREMVSDSDPQTGPTGTPPPSTDTNKTAN